MMLTDFLMKHNLFVRLEEPRTPRSFAYWSVKQKTQSRGSPPNPGNIIWETLSPFRLLNDTNLSVCFCAQPC